ncbi:MAG: hypothetical protein DME26_15925 [Verrucomicrobia bacterium]|nr:MAG: hypothetical protein DME26_15925 [Verrucomicrobiota bacterium]
MNSPAEFLNQPVILALGWALLHFLWQGAAIAALLFVAQAFLRKSSANARYFAAGVALLLMAASPLATICYLENHRPRVPIPTAPAITSVQETIVTAPAEMSQPAFMPLFRPVQIKSLARAQNLSRPETSAGLFACPGHSKANP